MTKIGFNTKTNTERIHLYNSGVLPTTLAVMRYTDNVSECKSLVDTTADLDDDEMEHVTFGGACEAGKAICVAFKGVPSINDMVHEASHAATAFCYVHDISFRPNDDEMHAYLTEWIFKCIYSFFNNKQTK